MPWPFGRKRGAQDPLQSQEIAESVREHYRKHPRTEEHNKKIAEGRRRWWEGKKKQDEQKEPKDKKKKGKG